MVIAEAYCKSTLAISGTEIILPDTALVMNKVFNSITYTIGDIDNNGTQSKLVPLLTVDKLITNLDDFEGLSAGGHIVDILMIKD